jgi:virginiamycin B lyase
MRRVLAALSLAAPGAAAGAQPAAAPPAGAPVPTREWPVPWKDSRPRDPVADGRGGVWFVGQAGNYVARLDTATGAMRRFAIDPGHAPAQRGGRARTARRGTPATATR